jgi:hypothetical protein
VALAEAPPEPEPEPTPEPAPEPEPTPEPLVLTSAEAVEMGLIADASLDGLGLGAGMGLGLPGQGNAITPSLSLTARLPVVDDLLDVSTTLSWYRLAYNHEERVVVPFLGPVAMDTSRSTAVVPLTADATFRFPHITRELMPVAGAGLGVYLARRSDDGGTQGGSAIGLHAFAGADLAIGLGFLAPRLNYHLARRDFGNVDATDTTVRESLDTTQLSISWLYAL